MGRLHQLVQTLSDLSLDCEYWDVRVEDSFETSIDLVDGEPVTCTSSPSLGAFLRVRKNGFWLYESTTDVENIKSSLTAMSQLNPLGGSSQKYTLEKIEPFARVESAHQRFSAVSLNEKLEIMKSYFQTLKSDKLVTATNLTYRDLYKVKSFYSSVGNRFEYDFNQGGVKLSYTLREGANIFDDRLFFYGSRFADLRGHERTLQIALEESKKFLTAPSVNPGKYKVLLDPEVAGVFTHESFGHKSEADFMLGDKKALEDWKIGSKVASEILSIVDYGGHRGTSGYCPIDDDGVLAKKNYLIKDGVLAGRLHSIDTAIELAEKPTGNSRAMNFEYEPIVRMTSTYIEPGTESLDSILEKSEGAILVKGVRHGSGLSTFTIAPTRGYMIGKGGERIPVRLSVISGNVFETLKSIEAVSSDFHLHSSAIGGCGKMDQWPLPVADGGPYVLVNEMQVS